MSTRLKFRPTTRPHPLHGAVVEIFRRDPHQDVTTLAIALSGCTGFSGKGAAKGDRAYRVVAEDVLGYMHSQGHLARDEHGWYVLAVPTKERP
jgi:hypothetical protein